MTAARKIRAAVVGASGYAGSELTRFLLAHPAVELTHLYVSAASSDAGRAIAEIDGRLFGRTQLVLEPMTDPAAAAQGFGYRTHCECGPGADICCSRRSGL